MSITLEYWGELRTHWRALVAATLGHGFGIGLNAYIAGLFGPQLLSEFKWERSQFALLGMIGLAMLVLSPLVGRLTDRFGVRAVALTGVLGWSFALTLFTVMNGDIRWFFALNLLQLVLGATTISPVYSRLIAERFVNARGLAFSIVMTGPPLAGAVMAPIIGHQIESSGWRSGYLLLSAAALCFGLVAVLMMPRRAAAPVGASGPAVPARADVRGARIADRGRIFGHSVFRIIMVGMVMASVPHAILSSQLKLMLMDSGASTGAAIWLVSLFAVGVILGRFACGLALDRLPAHFVAATAIGLPAIGMFLLASSLEAPFALAVAVMLLGLAYGAEGDIAAYFVARHFEVRVFSTVLGFVGAAIAGGSAGGALLLGAILHRWNSYTPFLIIGAIATLIAAACFFSLGQQPRRLFAGESA